MGHQFQFSLRNLMVAMAFLSLWGAWNAMLMHYIGPPPSSESLYILLFVVGNSITLGLPVIAISALFGRIVRGIVIWAAILTGLSVLVMILRLLMDFP
jgi:hypothetical protein